MYLHRASFLHEGVLLRLLDPTVQAQVRLQLAGAWGREILWCRSGDAEPVVRDHVGVQVPGDVVLAHPTPLRRTMTESYLAQHRSIQEQN